jgi:hypothetical protein
MPDNIFPDQSKSAFDIKYNQLKILASDALRKFFNRGVVTTTPISQPQTGSGGGDDTPIPPGDSGCKKLYVANLSQTGTANPGVNVYENTIGPIVWSRISTGLYRGTLTDAFPIGRTWVMVDTNYLKGMDDKQVKFNVTVNDDYVEIQSEDGNALSDDVLNNTSIEIRTYCVSEDVVLGDFIISQTSVAILGFIGHFEFQGMSASQTGYVDWGDGSALEAFTSGAGGTMTLEHTYIASGTFTQSFYFDANSVITLFVNGGGGEDVDVIAFSHTDNFTALEKIELFGIVDITNVLPPAATNINGTYYHGSGFGTASSADFTLLPSTVRNLKVWDFTDLITIDNLPTSVNISLDIQRNPLLTTIDYTGTPTSFFALVDNNSLSASTVMSLNMGKAFINTVTQNFSVSDVNAILVHINGFGTSFKFLVITQTPPAPPSGTGATAASALTSRGWTLTTD